MSWVITSTNVLKEEIRKILGEVDGYQGDPLDDYWVYHPEEHEEFDSIFGSLVRTMTPIGDVYVFSVKERRAEYGYRVTLIGTDGD